MHADRITGLTLLGMCVFGWFFLIPMYVPGDVQQIFPRAILIFISLPSLAMCLRKTARAKTAPPDPSVTASRRAAFIRMLTMAAVYLAYLLLIPVVGFFVSSACAAVGFLLFLGVRSPKAVILVPAVMLAAIHIVIERFLHFELPSGILF